MSSYLSTKTIVLCTQNYEHFLIHQFIDLFWVLKKKLSPWDGSFEYHNIFWLRNKKIHFNYWYTLLSKGHNIITEYQTNSVLHVKHLKSENKILH